MAKVYPFPGQDTRALIHTAVQLFAMGRWTKQQMMSQVFDTLKQHGVSRLNLGGYSVRIAEAVITGKGTFPVVIIEAKKVCEEPHCPACRSEVAGYLAGDEIVVVMCRDCGCIYKFKEVIANEKG